MGSRISKYALPGLLCLPLAAWAGGDTGLYLGGGVGYSNMEADANEISNSKIHFHGDDTGYKGIVGFNFGIIPLIDLAVEGSYVNFGKITDSTALGHASVEATGFDGFGVGALTFGPFGVFAKAGAIKWDSKSHLGSNSFNDSGTDPAYGVGARFQLGSFSLRAEYEWFDVNGLKDLTMTSVSALYTF